MNLKDKKIIVAISGGIAVYKVCDLVRQLQKEGAVVRVAMTHSATKFVGTLTFETLTNHEVSYRMFPENQFISTRHIDWADWADVIVFAPATANIIGKLANGFSDDIVTTIACAFHGPKIIAPAMNSNMWNNPIVQNNLTKLESFGYHVMPTEIGELACGWVGEGRLAPWQHIVQYVYKSLSEHRLKNKHVLITSGPTIEDIDPVRYLTNRSSGKMGHALAYAAWAMGAKVTLISGQTNQPFPFEITIKNVRSAEEMHRAVEEEFPESDIYISAAAIADYTPKEVAEHKLKKSEADFSIALKRTKDILTEVENYRTTQLKVGFAVETKNEIENAQSKIKRKNLDYVVLNNPKTAGAGFETDTNKVTILSKSGDRQELDLLSKKELAFQILNHVSNSL